MRSYVTNCITEWFVEIWITRTRQNAATMQTRTFSASLVRHTRLKLRLKGGK